MKKKKNATSLKLKIQVQIVVTFESLLMWKGDTSKDVLFKLYWNGVGIFYQTCNSLWLK